MLGGVERDRLLVEVEGGLGRIVRKDLASVPVGVVVDEEETPLGVAVAVVALGFVGVGYLVRC